MPSNSGHGWVTVSLASFTVSAATAAGPLTVTPAGGLTSTGTAGGPFTPSSLSYTLTNTGTAPMNWTASKAQSWVTLSAAGGTLAAGATTTVTASINAGANSLAASGTSYTDTVTFTNTTNDDGEHDAAGEPDGQRGEYGRPADGDARRGPDLVGDGRRSVHPVEPVVHAYEHGHRPDELDGVEGAVVGDLVGGRRYAGGGRDHDGDGVDQRRREQPGGQRHQLHRHGDVHQHHQRNAGNTTRPVSLTVNAANTAGPLTVTPAGGLTSSGTAGGPFTPSSLSYTLTNTGTAPMNWTASKAQSWVTLSAAGGTLAAGATTTVTASINSGANSLAAGGYTDTVTFTNTTNRRGNTTRPVSLTVNAAEAPTISTVSLPAGAVGTAYSQTLAATGGTTPYSWSVSSGTLPAGLNLSATGVLDGMPTAEGTSIFTVRVAGANSASSTKDFSVTINAAAPPPTVDLSSDSGGACSVAVRTGSGGSYIDGTLILAGLGMAVWGIRIRRRRG